MNELMTHFKPTGVLGQGLAAVQEPVPQDQLNGS